VSRGQVEMALGLQCWPNSSGGRALGLGWASGREGKRSNGLWTKEKRKGEGSRLGERFGPKKGLEYSK
jgi:hypothetical protein